MRQLEFQLAELAYIRDDGRLNKLCVVVCPNYSSLVCSLLPKLQSSIVPTSYTKNGLCDALRALFLVSAYV